MSNPHTTSSSPPSPSDNSDTTHQWKFHQQSRAVVPPHKALDSPDILLADRALQLESPFPIGLGISKIDTSHPFPLFYVSPRAAEHRSPKRGSGNGAGVREGWYLIAEPGVHFKIVFSSWNDNDLLFQHPALTDAHSLALDLFVDGLLAERGVMERGTSCDASFTGFHDSYEVDQKTGEKIVKKRRFSFCKSLTAKDAASADEDSGCIRIEVKALKCGAETQNEQASGKVTCTLDRNDKVNEKEAAKNGISIGVRRDGQVVSESHPEYEREILSESLIEEAGITIFIRERFWLQSRRIIDEADMPVKHVKKTVSNQVIDVDHSHNVDSEDVKPSLQRKRKVLKEVIDLEQFSYPTPKKKPSVKQKRMHRDIQPDMVIDCDYADIKGEVEMVNVSHKMTTCERVDVICLD